MTALRREGEWPGRVILRWLFMRGELRPWDDDADAAVLRVGYATDGFVDQCIRTALTAAPIVRSPVVSDDDAGRWETRGFRPELELMVMESSLATTSDVDPDPLIHRGGIDGLRDVDNAAFEKPWRVSQLGLEDAMAATPFADTLAITREGEITAFAIVGADRHGVAYLQRIATAPQWRGQGFGSHLIEAAHSWAVAKGCERLLLNVRPDAKNVIDLYLAHHFEPHDLSLRVFRRDNLED
ncbi:MAG: GNAT family N-acetyltransferase [Acidimicrobiia bacterium]|nr:GNAT family N-acetyltransferase [Acidimicrobiia bacterium]